MKKIINIIFFSLLFVPILFADTIPGFFIPNTAYHVGEVLKYDLKLGMVKGGEATMTVNLVPVGYSYAYHFKTEVVTTGIAKRLATVYDIYESYVEIETKLPIKTIRNIREENYTSYNEVVFDRNNKRIISISKGNIDSVPDVLLDIVAIFYYARNALFKYGKEQQSIPMQLLFNDDIYPLDIHYIKNETVKTNFGKIDAMLFAPVTNRGSIFANEDELKIWISDDENFIPLKLWAKIPVGTIKIDISGYEELRNELVTIQQLKKEVKAENKRKRKIKNNPKNETE